MESNCYKLASQDVVFEDFDGDLVVLNLKTGQYFGFNISASAIWDALVAGVDTEEIVQVMPAHREQVASFVQTLLEAELLAPSDLVGAPVSPELKAALLAISEAPVVSVFDDLADLIVADPIHDTVEDRGWPVLPD